MWFVLRLFFWVFVEEFFVIQEFFERRNLNRLAIFHREVSLGNGQRVLFVQVAETAAGANILHRGGAYGVCVVASARTLVVILAHAARVLLPVAEEKRDRIVRM